MGECFERRGTDLAVAGLAAKMFEPMKHRPRRKVHYRRSPVSTHPNAVRCIVAIHPDISRPRTNRTDYGHRRASANADSNRQVRSGDQSARQKHHRNHRLFHLLVLPAPMYLQDPCQTANPCKSPLWGFPVRRSGGSPPPAWFDSATFRGAGFRGTCGIRPFRQACAACPTAAAAGLALGGAGSRSGAAWRTGTWWTWCSQSRRCRVLQAPLLPSGFCNRIVSGRRDNTTGFHTLRWPVGPCATAR